MKKLVFCFVLIACVIPAFTQNIIFEDNFEEASFKSNWSSRPGSPNGIVDMAEKIGNNKSKGVRMGKSAFAGGHLKNSLDLRLNLSGQNQVEMTFSIRDLRDETHMDDGIFFSDNKGKTFKKVFSFHPSDWCDQYGQYPPIDIASLASAHSLILNDKFIIRFQQYGDNTLGNDGFYLDDVRIYVPHLSYATVPFSDNFEAESFGSAWSWSFADQTNTLAKIATRPSNVVELFNGIGVNNSRGVRMGKSCADGFATNALDLHLNLQGQSKVALSFFIRDFRDETHIDDGLYFSENGGISFKKVFSFLPSDWCDQYGQFPPIHIDELASINGLTLSSKFIIRFQQHGDNTIGNDGFYLDEVKVYVPVLMYASLPFSDDFEAAGFGSAWSWSFADQTNTLASIPSRPSNILDLFSGVGFNRSRVVRMGKSCADGFATNALDLHLNLSGKNKVNLSFKVRDLRDETQIDDGIYFSDNGGKSFKKVFDFDFSNVADVFTDYLLDIDLLVARSNLKLTQNFIIRFQQHGEGAIGNDGIYLDNVRVASK